MLMRKGQIWTVVVIAVLVVTGDHAWECGR